MKIFVKKLFMRLGLFSIGSLGSALLNLVLLPVTTSFLTPEEYGKTSMFFLAQTFLIYIIYLGFDQAFTREYHDQMNKCALLQQAMIVPLIGAMALQAILIIFSSGFSRILFASPTYSYAIYLLAGSISLLIFERFILLYIRMQNHAVKFSVYSILVKLVVLLTTLFFLYMYSPTFITVVYGMLGGQMIGDCILIIGNYKFFFPIERQIDCDLIHKLMHFGLPIVIGTFLYSLLMIIDKVMLRHFTDFSSSGIYTAGFKIASALMVLQISFANFWVPTAYEWFKQRKPIYYYERVSHLIMFLISLFFLFMVFFKESIIYLLSREYAEAQYVFPLLCFYPLMMTISETTNLGIVFSKKSHLNIAASFIAVAVAFICHLLLIPISGAIGAACATAAGYLTFFLSRTYFSMKHWEGFSVKRQVTLTLILYIFAIFVAYNRNIWLEKSLTIALIIITISIYNKEVRQILQYFIERKQKKI